MISGIVLVLLIVCNFVDKPIAKVGSERYCYDEAEYEREYGAN